MRIKSFAHVIYEFEKKSVAPRQTDTQTDTQTASQTDRHTKKNDKALDC